jgi:NAD(P)H-flavin reductase
MGNIGVVTAILDRLPIAIPGATRLVTCGPEVMMKYVARSALQRGITADRVWVSMERNMQCAVGLCGHCQWGREFICKDGPVLRYDRIHDYFNVESL